MEGYKLKEIKQRIGEYGKEYAQIFKDIPSQISSKLDPALVVIFFVDGLQQRIKTPILMNKYTTYEDVLNKELSVE